MRLIKSISLLIIIIIIVVFIRSKKDNSFDVNKDTIQNSNVIEVLVIYVGDNFSYAMDNNQIIYKLNKELEVNSHIQIEYKQELNKNKELQDIEILNITKLDRDFQLKSMFSSYRDKAMEIANRMSKEELLGQLYMVHHSSNIASNITKYNLGGIIFFGSDFTNKEKSDVLKMVEDLQSNAKIPLLLAVDEEGGIVTRISSNKNLTSERFKSPRQLYSEGGFRAIREDNIAKNNILQSLNLNINLAPVLDISNNKEDYIYSRSIGLNPELTGVFAQTIIESSKNSKISNVMKHYPGYSGNKDTHKISSIDKRTMVEIEQDLIPFKKGIESGGESIMFSHNIVEVLDIVNPVSISITAHNYLRNKYGFNGIIMTDALNMGATRDIDNIGIKSILAGNDILITKEYERDIKDIIKELNNNKLSDKYIYELALKVIEWKIVKGLI